jgi:hypothetical protein
LLVLLQAEHTLTRMRLAAGGVAGRVTGGVEAPVGDGATGALVAGLSEEVDGALVQHRCIAPGTLDDVDLSANPRFSAGPVEPRGNLLPFRPHAAGRGPVGERTAPSREPRDEIVESGVVKSGRRRRGDDGRSVIRARRGHVGHLENSRPQS